MQKQVITGQESKNQYYSQNVKFHSVCVDNFFNNPDSIREFALKQEFIPTENGNWPGERTMCLHDIDEDLNNLFFAKVFSTYFPVRGYQIKFEKADAMFQKIKPFSKEKDSWKNMGWIHSDNDWSLAGLIYLTPNFNRDAGTSLFNLKKKYKDTHSDWERVPMKHKLYTGNDVSYDEYKKELIEHNSKFLEKTNFKNIYNRMVMYDGHEYHGANSFYNKDEKERLTLVYFVNGITIEKSPIEVIKGKVDENIENKIKSI